MGVLRETSSWCFCTGAGRSEKVKGGVLSTKGPAMAAMSSGGTGFLIHRSLLLTTHANIPSSTAAAEVAEIQIHHGRLSARLVPQRFFITSSILDLTIVGLDILDSESSPHVQQPSYLKTNCNTSLELGNVVYILGYPSRKELSVGEGKVVIATDNLLKLSTDGVIWCPGSAGFDSNGNLAFMVCDPMKRGASPTAKSSSTSSSSSRSWKKDHPMQFGIPIPIICDWLYKHWEGNLDELCKPKLPLRRLIPAGQKNEHSCSSFNMRSVFKPCEEENGISSTSQIVSKPRHDSGASSSNDNTYRDDKTQPDMHSTRGQGIPTPEIYESPSLTSGPVCRKENTHVQLLDINFPPRGPRSIVLPFTIRRLFPDSNGDNFEAFQSGKQAIKQCGPPLEIDQEHEHAASHIAPPCVPQEDCCSEVHSCSSPLEASDLRNEGDGFTSEGETMYSAETMESRNNPSPRQDKFQLVRRSKSCASYSGWSSNSRNSTPQKPFHQKQQSTVPVRKTHSQAGETSHRGHDFCSPTVSSIMKKRNYSEPRPGIRKTVIRASGSESEWPEGFITSMNCFRFYCRH